MRGSWTWSRKAGAPALQKHISSPPGENPPEGPEFAREVQHGCRRDLAVEGKVILQGVFRAIHGTKQLKKKIWVCLWGKHCGGEGDPCCKQHEWLLAGSTEQGGNPQEKKQCLASFRRASGASFAWSGLEGLLVIGTAVYSDSANFQ